VSNAHVARALNAPVIIVSLAKDGSIGNTVDHLNQGLEYFKAFDCRVIGNICNKLPEVYFGRVSGILKTYFEKRSTVKCFGFVKFVEEYQEEEIEDGCKLVTKRKLIVTEEDMKLIDAIYRHFKQAVDFKAIHEMIEKK
jgi:cobyrinic acid a,c-diamide synthase